MAKEHTREMAEKYAEYFANPFAAAKQGLVDEVIHPLDTRKMIISAVEMAANKREQRPAKKHGIMPL